MANLEEALQKRPAPLAVHRIPIDQIQLPESFGEVDQLSFEEFVKRFCRTYRLQDYLELANLGQARLGREGLEKLYDQYLERLQQHKALELKKHTDERRRTLLAGCLGVTLVAAGFDQAVKRDLDQEVLEWTGRVYAEETDAPFAVHATKYFPTTLDHVESHQNNLDMASTTMLMNCHAEGYVLTECREGMVYKPRPYQEHPVDDCTWETFQTGVDEDGKPEMHSYRSGACGEAFFELDGYHSYNWSSKTPGKIEDTYWYSDRYRYHPVSPSAEDLCAEKKTGVYIAPIVDVKRGEELPASCRAAGVFPVMNH